jgi:hypothetical protein
MITQKETLNKIAELRWLGYGVQSIAAILGLVVQDVHGAVTAYKFKSWTEFYGAL